MMDVVVPIDYSSDIPVLPVRAIARYRRDPVRIHLLNVQRPLPRHVSQFFASADLRDYHHECGMRLLQEAVALLDAAEVPPSRPRARRKAGGRDRPVRRRASRCRAPARRRAGNRARGARPGSIGSQVRRS
jgi:hypothetical protein